MLLVQTILILAIAASICTLLVGLELPVLRKLKAGQSIREDGPQAHLAKTGTPTMGGIAIIVSYAVCFIAYAIATKMPVKECLFYVLPMLLYGLIGFADDFIIVVKHNNDGLSPKQKMALQIVLGIGFAIYRYYYSGSNIYNPFTHKMMDFGIWIIPFTVFVFVAMTNAVNLTDGLDGLSSSVTLNASLTFAALCISGISLAGDALPGETKGFSCIESGASALILAGCCIGFLIYNHHPAKVFMGDTGSLGIGAALTSAFIIAKLDFLLPVIGLIYVLEVLSDIIQVGYFKLTHGKRIFRMAPLHHHFELGGWSEVKVDTVFSVSTLILGILTVFWVGV